MPTLNLRSRLLLSHLLVMGVGLGSFIIISKVYSPRLFILQLERLEQTEFFNVRSVKTYLVRGFETAWNRSTLWSVGVGATAAGALSYWVAQRITEPLTQMREITQKFAAGNLDERMVKSEIPELNQLSLSFNRMAESIEGIEQRRRDLISDMTHELRTPLTVMRGYLEEMSEGRIEPSDELYHRLIRETRRLERLVNDLQELSKAEAGYLIINLQPLNLQPFLKSLVARFGDQLLEDGPTLTLECPANLPPVLVDVDRTEQILVNLLGNAVRYTEKGSIRVKVWQDVKLIWIAVIDTGIGISEEDLPHIFERFWRGERSRSRQLGGTGIGLAITKRLVELQGGTIEVESKLGQGSTFRFSVVRQ
ncbi:MAG: HAMP domain-containing sensor histidine kinase [Cyanobacteriota bacterium]|nr:HAMP domain-containing sensor histidine kinase [Cyanobacteriota bacterium]